MHRRLAMALPGLLLLLLATVVRPSAAAEDKAWQVAFIGPLSGPLKASAEESLLGLRAAATAMNERGGMAGEIPVEILPFDDGDTEKGLLDALKAVEKRKCRWIFAATTGVTTPTLVEKVRRGRTPLFLVGSAGPRPSLDPLDPVLSMAPWPVDQAMATVNFLAIHSEKEHLGLHGDCLEPGLVVESTERGRELADAVARNLGPRQHLAGRVEVAPHGIVDIEALKKLRAARCDRLVLVGEPDLLDGVAEALAVMKWEVPVYASDGMLSRAAVSVHDGRLRRVNFLEGLPQWFGGEPPVKLPEIPAPLLEANGDAHGRQAPVYARSVQAYTALHWVGRGAEAVKSLRAADLLAGTRAVAYDAAEANMPVIDETGRAALYHWYLWRVGEKGPERVNPLYLPQEGRGQLFRMLLPERFKGEPDTKIVWLTFGDENSKLPRTIERDMGEMGLGSRGYEGDMDQWLLDELMARTLSKLNRLFLRNLDGTAIPGVSYAISFTAEKPEGLKNHEYWKGVIAGDDTVAGGRAWPGEGRVEIYSTYMWRTDAKFHDAALKPKMNREDKPYLDMTYPWGESKDRNERSDRIRALVDGYASFFALTGAHEFGHVAGLGHDTESGRSIMNVVEGAGIRETNAWFIPGHRKVLERVLGIVGEKKR